jgi:hypothetical protein
MPTKAEVRAPHPAELLVLQVPSQWILEAGAATSRDQAQGATGSVARCELQSSREEGSRDEPPLGGLWRSTDETEQQGELTRSCGTNKSAPELKATSAAHPDVLPETNPAAVVKTQRQKEARREAGAKQLPEQGGPVEVQLKLRQEESWAEARKGPEESWAEARKGPEESWAEARRRPEESWAEARERPEAGWAEGEVERACGKRGGNGEGEQESCGNGDKRPAGIAASREKWEDFCWRGER